MTIKDCIDIVDNVKPNQYSVKDKVMWLSFIEEIIINEVLKTHEGYDGRYDDFEGYTEEKLTVTLIVPSPYDRLYTAYLKMKIDAENGEVARYNNSSALYNTYMLEYRKHYNKTHMPLDSSAKKEAVKPNKTSSGISEAEYENLVKDLTFILTEYFSDTISEDKVNDVVTEYMQTNAEMLKGNDGYTPKKGTDYFTEEEIAHVIANAKGDDGYSPTVKVTETADGHSIAITDKDGTKVFSLSNGKDGVVPTIQVADINGRHRLIVGEYGENQRQTIWWDDGKDGTSPTVSIEDTVDGHKVSIQDAEGIKEFDVPNGVGVASVHQSVVSPDDNGNNVITITLTDGTQTSFKVKNGSQGRPGDKGDTLTYADLTEEDKADLVKDVYKKTDTYSKKEVDNKFGNVYSKEDTYSKEETYHKGEIDEKLIPYMAAYEVNSLVNHMVVGNAPPELNTLEKIADAIGNDENFAETISNELSNKADADNVYIKSQVDSKIARSLSQKADKIDVYTKDEVDEKISAEVSSIDISKAANALKGNASGEIVVIDDISPIVHEMDVKADGRVIRCGKNLIPYPYAFAYTSDVGVTCTPLEDGGIKVSGTNTGSYAATFFFVGKNTSYVNNAPIKKGTYYLSGSSGDAELKISYFESETAERKSVTAPCVLNFTEEGARYALYINIGVGKTVDAIVYPQFELGDIATDFEKPKTQNVYTPNASGNVKIPSLYPTTILFTEADGAVIEAEYNRDLNKVSFGGDGNYVEQIAYDSTDGSLQGRVYVVDRNNVQTTKELRIVGNYDSIPVRDASGNFYVGTPKLPLHCINKQYLEEIIKGIEERLTAGGL